MLQAPRMIKARKLMAEICSSALRPLQAARRRGRTGLIHVLIALSLAACASHGDVASPVTGERVDDVPWAFADVATLEGRIEDLSSTNATLRREVADLRTRLAAAEESATAAAAAAAEARRQLAARERAALAASSNPPPAAVISAPDADLGGAASPAPVAKAPRLVQPTFASAQPVFENEADGDALAMTSVLWGVHLDSYSRLQYAREGWRRLQREYPDELGLLEPRTERIEIEGRGAMFRLIGGAFASETKADALCQVLNAKSQYCRVVSYEGERLSMADPS